MSCKRKNLQRAMEHTESEFSNTSILSSMGCFIRAVREMEETILIPSRLLDLAGDESRNKFNLEGDCRSTVKRSLANTDLYQLFNTISQIKVELLWSQEHANNDQELEENFVPTESFRTGRTFSSTSSIHSVQSSISASSDSESDLVTENDSESENDDAIVAIAGLFNRHLREFHQSIRKMTQAAEYLTQRYQTDVDRRV